MTVNLVKKNFALLLIGFFALSITFVLKYKEVVDILPSDDFVYLNSGLFFSYPIESLYIGPVYSFWYYVIHFFTQNSIHTYFFNYFFVSIFSVFLINLLAQKLKFDWVVSLLISSIFLFSSFNLFLLPKISQFALIFIISGFYLSIEAKNLQNKLVVIALASLFLSYIRPEFYIAYIGSVIVLISKARVTNLRSTAVVILVGVLFYFIFGGIPLGSRSFDAFMQHYVRSYLESHQSKLTLENYSETEIFRLVYNKNCNTLISCVIEEPLKFTNHLMSNLTLFFKKTYSYLSNIFFDGVGKIYPIYVGFLKICLVIFLFIFVDWKKTISKIDRASLFKHLIPLSIIIFPTFISIFIVYPREHYLLFVIVLMLVWLIGLISIFEYRHKKAAFVFPTFLFVLLSCTVWAKTRVETQNKTLYKFVEKISNEERVVVLDYLFSRVFFGNKILDLQKIDTQQTFEDLILKNKVRVIHICKIEVERGLSKLSGFQSFIDNYDSKGFVKVFLNHSKDDYVLIEKNLFENYHGTKYFLNF